MHPRRRAPENERLRAVLAELFEIAPREIAFVATASPTELVVEAGGHRLAVSSCSAASTARIADACARAERASRAMRRRSIPIVVVPFAGAAAIEASRRAGVGFVDLAGNARIVGRGVHIRVEGRADPNPRRGRPVDTFAPRSSRIVTRLVDESDRLWTRRELARAAKLDEGRTSRLVARLMDEGYVDRRADRSFRLVRRDLLVDAFRDARPFGRETVRRGTIVTRSYEAVARVVRDLARDEGLKIAATGQLAAHLHAGTPGGRIASFYIESMPSEGALALVGFRDDPRAGNVWLVVPRDPDLFDDVIDIRGVPVVPPLRAYVDLADHPDPSGAFATSMRAIVSGASG